MKTNIPFLATTAIEEFWDTSHRIVFLSLGCKRYSRRNFWRNIASETLPVYFEEKEAGQIYCYLNIVYERILLILHKQMNRIHGTDFSVRYWRIILGSWLIFYIHVMFDRFSNLEHFIKLYPDFTSIGLERRCFIIPKDTVHFINHIKNDDYNLQIYSNILAWMGYKLPTKEFKVSTPDVAVYFGGKRGWIKKALRCTYEKNCKIFQNKNQVLLSNTYFPYLSLFKLSFNTKASAWPVNQGYQPLPVFPVDHAKRKILGSCDFGDNKFEKMLAALISYDMPQYMVEGFSILKEKSEERFVPAPKAIMSAISWWFDNAFQLWAAGSAEKGTLLLGVQHGGNYGIAKNLLGEDFELGLVDKFYSWGWERYDAYAEVLPMPAPKLIEKKKRKLRSNSLKLLYVTGSYPRYLVQFPWSVSFWEDYFLNQGLFISSLAGTVQRQLRVRPHREDLGWDVRERIRDQFPQVKIEDWGIPFSRSLNECSIYISDHPLQGTTFMEALSCKKPTVIFYNPGFAANMIRDEARELIAELKNNSVIFDDPVKAANQLNSVYGSIEIWWNEPKRQKAVSNFLNRFGKSSSNWLRDWSREMSNCIVTQNKRAIV